MKEKKNENERTWILLFVSALDHLLPSVIIAYRTKSIPQKDIIKHMIRRLTEEDKLESVKNELSRKLLDLPHSQMKEILEEAADTNDSMGRLSFVVIQPSLFPTGPKFTATILSKLLDTSLNCPNVFQIFNGFNLTLKDILMLIKEEKLPCPDNLECILTSFNFTAENIYVEYCKEKDIFEKEPGKRSSPYQNWVSAANGPLTTFALTSPRFENRIFSETLMDPLQENDSPLMRIIEEGETMARQRLEFLDVIRKHEDTYEDAVELLKKEIPVTNPITIALILLYPITTAEKLKFGFLTALSSFIEVGSTTVDLFTDIRVSILPYLDASCEIFVIEKYLGPAEVLDKMSENTTIHFNQNQDMAFCSFSECSFSRSMIPYFSIVSLLITVVPWLLGMVIILGHRKQFWDI